VRIDEIEKRLFMMRDEEYASFQQRIIPSVSAGRIIGVRTPALREYAKELSRRSDIDDFLGTLPHPYFDVDQLHAFIISLDKDFDRCIAKVERFLPYIDNWATCDQLSPKSFSKAPEKLLPYIEKWLSSGSTYTVRFAVGMLMRYFLDNLFRQDYPETVSRIRSDEFYIKMMVAWYFATALAKQYDSVIHYIEDRALDAWTHNKAIQKSIESFRITPEQKEYLRSLKVNSD
jgi:3-methyladenine DNA glycosylase AlkD